MKKRKFSKVIAVALAALMVVGMMPMMAFADYGDSFDGFKTADAAADNSYSAATLNARDSMSNVVYAEGINTETFQYEDVNNVPVGTAMGTTVFLYDGVNPMQVPVTMALINNQHSGTHRTRWWDITTDDFYIEADYWYGYTSGTSTPEYYSGNGSSSNGTVYVHGRDGNSASVSTSYSRNGSATYINYSTTLSYTGTLDDTVSYRTISSTDWVGQSNNDYEIDLNYKFPVYVINVEPLYKTINEVAGLNSADYDAASWAAFEAAYDAAVALDLTVYDYGEDSASAVDEAAAAVASALDNLAETYKALTGSYPEAYPEGGMESEEVGGDEGNAYEAGGTTNKSVSGNTVTFTGEGDDAVVFNALINAIGSAIVSVNTSARVELNAKDNLNFSFDYEGLNLNEANSVTKGQDVSFSITNMKTDYSATITLTRDDIETAMKAMNLGDYVSYIDNAGIELPITIEGTDITVTPTYKAYAVNVNNEEEIYELEVTETDDGATFSVSNLPFGDYSIVVEYEYVFGFSYSTSIPIKYNIVDITISSDGSVPDDHTSYVRMAASSDTFSLSVVEEEPEHEHTWGEPEFTWSWSDGFLGIGAGASCSATITCETCGETETVRSCTVTSATTKEATCTEEGETTYTATANFTTAGTYTDSSYTRSIDALGHDWNYDAATFEWANDYSNCTATYICKTDSSHTDTVNCTIATTGTPASCIYEGELTYTASFTYTSGSVISRTYTVTSDPVTVHYDPTGIHDYVLNEELSVAPTDTEDGYNYYECSVCGDIWIETINAGTTTEELEGGITKTVDGNNISFKGGADDKVSFTAHMSAYGDALGNEVNEDDIEVPGITAADNLNVSFTYGGFEDGAIAAEAGADSVSFTISDVIADYTATVSLYEDEIAAVMEAMDMGDYTSFISLLGLDFPIVVTSNDFELIPTFSAYAVDENGDTVAVFAVTEEDGVYTFTCTNIPAGDYDIVVEYTLDFGFSYKDSIPIYYSLLGMTIDLAVGVEGSASSAAGDDTRVISSSDSFTLSVAEDIGSGEHVHEWSNPEFSWSWSDGFLGFGAGASCTATISCWCGDSETVNCTVTSEDTTPATCTEAGETTYTATAEFENIEGTYTDSSYTRTIDALGHDADYSNITWNWADDYSSCTAVMPCTRCDETEAVTQTTTVTSEGTAATCVDAGEMTYTASFTVGGILGIGGTTYSDTQNVHYDATGHTAGIPVMENQTDTSYDEVVYCEVCGEELSRETIQVEAEQKIPQTSTETIGEITKTVYGQNVSFTGDGNDTSVNVAVSVLGEDYPVGEINVEDSVSASFKYDGVYVDGTFTADSGTDVTFGVSDFTYSYEPTIVITEELITGVLDQLGLGSFVSMLPALGLDLPIVIDTASGYVTDTMANVTYVVTAVAEDGTVYDFDVVYDGNNATFTCAGLPDGDYEVTVAYDIDLGFVYDYMVSVMGIEISAADTAESVRVISSSDSFTLSVYEGGVMGDTGTSEGPSREIIPQESEEELEGGITKTVYGNDVEFAGGSSDDVVVDVAVSVLGEDYSVGEIAVEDNLDITFDYTGTYADGTIEVASGEDVVFGVSDFTYSYEPTIIITEELITGVLDQLGLGGFVSMLPMLGLDLPIVIDTESGYVTDTMANVTYVVTAVAEDGTVYDFDVVYDGNNATFTCSGMPDGDYEVTVAYEIDLGFVYDYMVSVMGIEISAADTVETARIVASADTFKLSIYEGASMEDQGSTGGSTGEEPGEEESGEEEPGEEEPGEEEPGEETEHEHSYYIVDSAEATCEDEGWVLYACSECGLTYTQYTAALGHDFVDGVCTRCGALEEEVGTTAGSGSSSKAASTTSEDEEEDEFEEAEDEDEFTEVEEDEFEVVEDEDLTSPATGASMAAIGAAMAFAAAGIVVVTRKKKEDEE